MNTRSTTLLLLTAGLLSLVAIASAQEGDSKPLKEFIRAADDLRIACEVRGRGDTALIFLHGWCGDREYWKHQVDVFAADYQVVAIDQAGHGESGKNRDHWSVSSLAGDVLSVVDALNLKRVILIGHSMGGPVALTAAKRLPGKVVGVIGVDTLQNAEIKMRAELVQQLLANFQTNFAGTMRGMFSGLVPESGDPKLKEWLTARAQAQDQKMALALMREFSTVDTKGLLEAVRVPVRCINSAGGYQFFMPTDIEANRRYGDYNAVFIESVGHYPMLEKPAEFNVKLRGVLKELTAKP